jgi:DNA-3-methyladenine glycosylase
MEHCSNSPNSRQEKALNVTFYRNPDVIAVAKGLLGKALFTQIDGVLTGGIIIETESYAGAEDRASHAYGNRRTARTEIMFAAGGVAYVYLCYGIHCLLNAVTGPENTPHAVLIRAIQPTHGIETMLLRRKKKKFDETLCKGPGALTAALGITLKQNKMALNCREIWIEETGIEPEKITATPRIGVDYAGTDALLPYRFLLCLKNLSPRS